MAYDVTSLAQYTEQHKSELLSATILSAPSIDMFSHIATVKGNTALNIVDNTIEFGDGSTCGWNAAGTTTFSQRVLEPAMLKVNMSFCPQALKDKWLNREIMVGAGKEVAPYEEMINQDIVVKVANAIESMIWTGDGTNNTFKGIANLGLAAAGATSVSAGATMIETVKTVYMAIPEEVIDKAVIFMSPAQYRQYVAELGAANLYHNDFNGELYVPNTNTRVVKVAGLTGVTTVYALVPEEVFYGFDGESDMSDYKFWYSDDNDEFRLKIRFNAGVQVAFPQHVVICN